MSVSHKMFAQQCFWASLDVHVNKKDAVFTESALRPIESISCDVRWLCVFATAWDPERRGIETKSTSLKLKKKEKKKLFL